MKFPVSVFEATKSDLTAIAKRSPSVASSSLAASALALAREMDSPASATSKSMCARALLDTMNRLLELAPAVEEKGDKLDDLSARRAARSRSAGA